MTVDHYQWFDPHSARHFAEEANDREYYFRREAKAEIESLRSRLAYEKGRADSQQKTISDIVSRLPWPSPSPVFIQKEPSA